MMQVIEHTHEEKMKMYMKCTKKKIIEMLIQCNKFIDGLTPQVKFISSNSDVIKSVCVCPNKERIPLTDDNKRCSKCGKKV